MKYIIVKCNELPLSVLAQMELEGATIDESCYTDYIGVCCGVKEYYNIKTLADMACKRCNEMNRAGDYRVFNLKEYL